MKLRSLRVAGFGKLVDRTFTFGPGLTVVAGPNEAGKSTLAAAIVATLYGLRRGDKERWEPWSGAPFATTLVYETAAGAVWEVQRDFALDAKGVHVYDERGVDAAAQLGEGRGLSPGEAHLGVPLDVFVQTACARQAAMTLDGGAAGSVSTVLARALDGGPKEDAAIGALARLDAALRKHVGTERAHKNAPLKKLRALEEKQAAAAADARAQLDALAELRERIATASAERDRDGGAAAELERRERSLRAASLRARLAALREYRAELAALQATRAAYDDVADFPAERVAALDEAYEGWRSAERVAAAAKDHHAEEALRTDERGELDERRGDAGTLDDDAVAALRAAAAQAESAHARAVAALNDAASARRDGDGGRGLAGGLLVATTIALCGAVGFAIAHFWLDTGIAAVIAVLLALGTMTRARGRSGRRSDADARQKIADAALAEERLAADTIARALAPLGLVSVDELVRRRERYVALHGREAAAHKAAERLRVAREAASAEGARFDALAAALLGEHPGTREERRAEANRRRVRRIERDGLDNSLAMLTVRRAHLIGGEDELALQTELDALLQAGVEPAAEENPGALRRIQTERAELEASAHDATVRAASLAGELRAAEEAVRDVATLDETLAQTRAEIARLTAFEAALALARRTVEARKDEAHSAFARRLEQYSADVLATITGARYNEVRLDPTNLAIRVRVPETRAFQEISRLSAGTQDQVALVVRFAMARMVGEGLETLPLLLDDPFAFWDAERFARCLPLLVAPLAPQCIVFTTDGALPAELPDGIAQLIDLDAGTPVAN
ncbi:MAG TPA: AAA family ATPase [Candidatus Sulfotelmatobacter sp.]|nr:AAA family ATPase [Candidatus Sulfotelmatobacter sp.]